MNFISGVVFIKEVVVISLMGWGLLNVIAIALCAMMVGGVRLHINGSRNSCDGERIVGSVISIAGLMLELVLFVLMNNDNAAIIPIFDSFGLTDRTGKYEVTVTADADMNEFQERYEIIGYENGVYTIKVRES